MDGFLRQTHDFFKNNKQIIEKNYPGITLQRFQQLLFSFPTLDLGDSFSRALTGEPLEYITGKAFFYKSEFSVNNNVLIPRFETELLVERATLIAKNLLKKKSEIKVIDIGTGSGAIGISLLAELDGKVDMIATDISLEALNVAKRNYYQLRFTISRDHSLTFIQTDRMEGISGEFDLILSNPPYIKRTNDKINVHGNVTKYEPGLALFLDDTVYDDWFIRLFTQVRQRLSKKGTFIMEGHEDHLSSLLGLAKSAGLTGAVVKDLTGRDRFLDLQIS